jgi:mannitol-1-phosphate/altronate dehydrogenase
VNQEILARRTELLRQMAALDTMEWGSLKAEYRSGSSGQPVGPYFKHQVWQDGANASRRVPSDEAPALEAAIANRQKFEALAHEFVEVTVRLTRASLPSPPQKKTTPDASFPRRPRSPT